MYGGTGQQKIGHREGGVMVILGCLWPFLLNSSVWTRLAISWPFWYVWYILVYIWYIFGWRVTGGWVPVVGLRPFGVWRFVTCGVQPFAPTSYPQHKEIAAHPETHRIAAPPADVSPRLPRLWQGRTSRGRPHRGEHRGGAPDPPTGS